MPNASKNVNALMLPEGAAASVEAQHFVGMPGAYRPGEPVLLDTIGLDLEGARALIESLGLPLVEVEHGHKPEAAPVPDHFPPRLEGNLMFGEGEEPLVPDAPIEAAAPTENVTTGKARASRSSGRKRSASKRAAATPAAPAVPADPPATEPPALTPEPPATDDDNSTEGDA